MKSDRRDYESLAPLTFTLSKVDIDTALQVAQHYPETSPLGIYDSAFHATILATLPYLAEAASGLDDRELVRSESIACGRVMRFVPQPSSKVDVAWRAEEKRPSETSVDAKELILSSHPVHHLL